MFRWTRNVPIFLRLAFVFVWATLIPLTVIIVLSDIYFGALQDSGQALQTSNQAIKITTNELAHLQSMHALLIALLPSITKNGTDTNAVQAPDNVIVPILNVESSFDVNSVNYQDQYQLASSPAMNDIRTILLNNNSHTTLVSEQQLLLSRILFHQWPQYKVAQDGVLIALRKPIPLKDASALLQKADTAYTPLLQSWQRIVDITEQVNTEVVRVGPSQVNPLFLGALLAIISSMIIVIAIAYAVNRSITWSLYRLIALNRRIVAGETTARSDLQGKDEIGRVASSMNRMLDYIVQLMQETRSSRDYLRHRVEKLIVEVKGVGEGNLRVRADVTDDALGLLASAFNYTIDELSSLVVQIKRVANQVEQSTDTMLEHSSKLVRIGDVQVQQIGSLNTDVEHMASASQEVAGHAQGLYSSANEAHQSASGGRLAVLQAVEEIGTIHQNIHSTSRKVHMLGEISQEINNIVEVIASIAYQTNRLALDAAIQAAATSAYGVEFSVVASNIRRLAEQAKNQASIIARIVRIVLEDITAISLSMQDIEREAFQGMKAAKDVEEVLTVIFDIIERQAGEATAINTLATQQLQSANMVEQGMHYTSETTRQNNAQMIDAVRHIQLLARLVDQLRLSVEVFKLRNDGGPPKTLPPRAQAAPQVVNAATPHIRKNSLVHPGQGQGSLSIPTANDAGASTTMSSGNRSGSTLPPELPVNLQFPHWPGGGKQRYPNTSPFHSRPLNTEEQRARRGQSNPDLRLGDKQSNPDLRQ